MKEEINNFRPEDDLIEWSLYTEKTLKKIEDTDRFMALMEVRHRGALIAMEVEKILGDEVGEPNEYPTTETKFNIAVKERANKTLKPIFDALDREVKRREAGYIEHTDRVSAKRLSDSVSSRDKTLNKIRALSDVAVSYTQKKVEAKRAEQKLMKLVPTDDSMAVEYKPQEKARFLGTEIYKLKTKGELPLGGVEVIRSEGYLVVTFDNDEDYYNFKGSKSASGGEFHRAIYNSEIGADMLLVKGRSRAGATERIITHERQHFINHSLFLSPQKNAGMELFYGIENESPLVKMTDDYNNEYYELSKGAKRQYEDGSNKVDIGLGQIKDEVLAYIRDESGPDKMTDFLRSGLYDHLKRNFNANEFKKVEDLLFRIRIMLIDVFKILSPTETALLVYHLIDIPLIKFPERIDAVRRYYEKRMQSFRALVPKEAKPPTHEADRLLDGLSAGVYEARSLLGIQASSIILDYDQRERLLIELKERMQELRNQYDRL